MTTPSPSLQSTPPPDFQPLSTPKTPDLSAVKAKIATGDHEGAAQFLSSQWGVPIAQARANVATYVGATGGTVGNPTVGTVDGYAATGVFNVRSSITGITVSAVGKHRLRLLMATENASSTGYQGNIQHIQLRRTA